MAEPRDDGGPAFPIAFDDRPGAYEAHPGMSLRDFFAAQALIGLVTTRMQGRQYPAEMAQSAYDMADAMLLARKA